MRSYVMGKISRQLTVVVLFALAFVSVLYFVVQPILDNAICAYYGAHPSITREKTRETLVSLQRYVQENQAASSDEELLAQWMKHQPLTILYVYRGDVILYDSTLFTSSGLHTHAAPHAASTHESVYSVAFSDGPASVSLTVFPEYGVIQMMNKLLLLLAGLLFLGIILYCIRKKLRHFTRLEREVLSVAGGVLDTPISVKGQDELAQLAECIDEMRVSLVAKLQREEERQQESYEWITALSHDLRTPLTMLTGYLEVIRRRSAEPAQRAYIDKACDRAKQLKEMSDMLFACFSPSALGSDACEPLSGLCFAEMISERAQALAEAGFTMNARAIVAPDIWIHRSALKRVLDNIFSNLDKYADPCEPIDLHVRVEDDRCLLHIESISRKTIDAQSSGFGLGICRNLMANMKGSIATSQCGDRFVYCLQWNTVREPDARACALI